MGNGPLLYYASGGGNDLNDGLSPGTAWATIEQTSRAQLPPGCEILFEGDTYRGALRVGPNAEGDARNPVLISSYGVGRAAIESGDEDGIAIESTVGVAVKASTWAARAGM